MSANAPILNGNKLFGFGLHQSEVLLTVGEWQRSGVVIGFHTTEDGGAIIELEIKVELDR